MINKQELAAGVRMAGQRAAAAAQYCQDWDKQLAHQWTSRDAFVHMATTAGAMPALCPVIESGAMAGLTTDQLGQMNAQAIGAMTDKSKDDIVKSIAEGHETSAKFVETLDDSQLQKEMELGGYKMPLGEVLAQVWINHQLGHAYEASARWPLT